MLLTALQDVVLAQLPDPEPEPPPGSEPSVALLPYLLWFHLVATLLTVVWWVRVGRGMRGGRRKAALMAVVALVVGLATALLGAAMAAPLE
ncbi:hypothetical protein [Nocardia transvalensis]|uniref:hypothetical protein n=1 Tax=Nocardia transvalensis TaxID=37333 RepID=UPI001895F288|nr:hypothetical protein [Nocardia transvalensis]MBF6328031.1 hypothetical protein [Nocardia transvalensis]